MYKKWYKLLFGNKHFFQIKFIYYSKIVQKILNFNYVLGIILIHCFFVTHYTYSNKQNTENNHITIVYNLEVIKYFVKNLQKNRYTSIGEYEPFLFG